jgi:hypothetical protein
MGDQSTISLKELVEQERITSEGNTPLPEIDDIWIRKHGDHYKVAPTSVSFTFRGECDLYPSEPLQKIVLRGFYTVTRDEVIVNMGRKGYELHRRPLEGDYPFQDKVTTVEFRGE